ncbi:uncharacterized protein LOC135200587 [Macrobrachium nipponense]|uniref:uncharacterized protein LOC135200587 n=1 Tax=Macrobrachium nipponense TaxID=159736 RepID=UPI0030C82C8B
MNMSGLSDVTSLPTRESENEEYNVGSDWTDDSDIDKNYEQPTSSDEDSEEFDEMKFQMRASKLFGLLQKLCLLLSMLCLLKTLLGLLFPLMILDDPAVPASDPVVATVIPAVPPSPPAAADDDDDDVPRIIDFQTSMVISKSGFACNCCPWTSMAVRVAARNNAPAYASGPVPEARSADTPE